MELRGPPENLPEDLKRVLNAAGPRMKIGGEALRDLWGQRSEEEGSSCDATNVISLPEVEDFPSVEDLLSPDP